LPIEPGIAEARDKLILWAHLLDDVIPKRLTAPRRFFWHLPGGHERSRSLPRPGAFACFYLPPVG
jgi:hypothetical protein